MTLKESFLIEEYKLLEHLRSRGNELIDNAVRLYLIVIGSFIAILSVIKKFADYDLLLTILSVFGLLFGIITCRYVIDHHISTTKYAHQLNILRGRFKAHINGFADVILLPDGNVETQPLFGRVGFEKRSIFTAGYTGIVIPLTSLCAFSSCYFLLHGLNDVQILLTTQFWHIFLASLTGMAFYLAVFRLATMRFRELNNELLHPHVGGT